MKCTATQVLYAAVLENAVSFSSRLKLAFACMAMHNTVIVGILCVLSRTTASEGELMEHALG